MKPLTDHDIRKELRTKLRVQEYGEKLKIDGVEIIDLTTYVDDSGYFLELSRFVNERFKHWQDFEIKQINYSEMLPGVIKAAHLHYNQEDIWFVPPSQRLLIGLYDVRQDSATSSVTMRFVMGAGKARLVYIPRGVAHGAANCWNMPAGILYFVNNAFDPDPAMNDEHRLPWDVFGKDFWALSRE